MKHAAFPDPVLTANVYCSGLLDDLLHQAIAPFWRGLREEDPENLCYLWMLRFARGGEHVKIRLHGPEDCREAMRRTLTDAIEGFFARLDISPAPAGRDPRNDLAPIDPEDEAGVAYPDRTILWTQYRRQPGTMGREPLSRDVTLAALFTRCISRGSEIVLRDLVPDSEGHFLQKTRMSLFLRLLVSGLAGLCFAPPLRASYLTYHRDWLIRAIRGDLAGVLARFEERVQMMPAVVATLEEVARGAGSGGDKNYSLWQGSAGELFEHVESLSPRPFDLADFYTMDQVLAPLFKVFHGLANLIQVGLPNEAFLCHVLSRAYASPDVPIDRKAYAGFAELEERLASAQGSQEVS